MQDLKLFITIAILALNIHFLFGFPLSYEDDSDEYYSNDKFKRNDASLLPNEEFSIVTNEKLLKLKELADTKSDKELSKLYNTVEHYVRLAKINNENVYWKYDPRQEGIVLTLKQNLNGILYYG